MNAYHRIEPGRERPGLPGVRGRPGYAAIRGARVLHQSTGEGGRQDPVADVNLLHSSKIVVKLLALLHRLQHGQKLRRRPLAGGALRCVRGTSEQDDLTEAEAVADHVSYIYMRV